MKRIGRFQIGLSLLMAAWVVTPQTVRACAVCYGESDAAMAKGMTLGMLMMLGLVVFVIWGGLGACFIYFGRRSARMNASTPGAEAAPAPDEKARQPLGEMADVSS